MTIMRNWTGFRAPATTVVVMDTRHVNVLVNAPREASRAVKAKVKGKAKTDMGIKISKIQDQKAKMEEKEETDGEKEIARTAV